MPERRSSPLTSRFTSSKLYEYTSGNRFVFTARSTGYRKFCTFEALLKTPRENNVPSRLKPMRLPPAPTEPAATPYLPNTASTCPCVGALPLGKYKPSGRNDVVAVATDAKLR